MLIVFFENGYLMVMMLYLFVFEKYVLAQQNILRTRQIYMF